MGHRKTCEPTLHPHTRSKRRPPKGKRLLDGLGGGTAVKEREENSEVERPNLRAEEIAQPKESARKARRAPCYDLSMAWPLKYVAHADVSCRVILVVC